jgi:hypothetical protein
MTQPGARPVLPAADLHARIREAAFALLLTHRRPATVDDLASLIDIEPAVLRELLDELAATGWIDRDSEGRVSGSAGLSLSEGPHRLEVEGKPFRTWCAYDSIGIGAALAADAKIETECAVCDRTLVIRMAGGRPPAERAERLWLASGGDSLRGDFCDPTVLLCTPEHAAAWAERQQGRGRAVDLAEAASLGAEEWASSAAVARVVRDQARSESSR